MENERISSALLGGARFASQMGRHFKNRTDQILLEISFQVSIIINKLLYLIAFYERLV